MSSRQPQPDFKAEFQQNMTQLDSIKTDIERKITEKAALSNQILPQLQDINRKLAGVLQKFNLLKGQISDLERRILEGDQGITDAGNKCIGLQDEIARLKQDLANSQQQQQDLEQTYNIRFHELTEEKDKMETSQDQMRQMINQLKTQEEYLKQQILESEARYRQLQGIMTQLSEENQLLKQQHIDLTKKIKDIRAQIDILITTDKVDPQQITDLLAQINKIIDEINDDSSSGNNSSGIVGDLLSGLTGNNSSSSSSSSSSSGTGSSSSGRNRLPLTTQIDYGGFNLTLDDIVTSLKFKNSQMRTDPNNKYAKALNELGSANNSQDIVTILSKNNIPIKSGRITGGKKSKKTKKRRRVRKQKGGFEYSGKSKRRRFSVTRSPRSSQSRSSQSRSSQQRSTYETQSMVPPKYKARGTKKSKM